MSIRLKAWAWMGALCLAAPLALAGPEAGDRSLTLTGTGSSDDSFDSNSFGVSGQFGWFQTDAVEWGLRQSFNGVINDDADDVWNGSTRGFVDYHFNTQAFTVPFIGANLGYIYGESVNNTGTAGLEAGLKFYVRDKTFIMAMAEYAFLFEDAEDIDDRFDDGAFFYTLGIGYHF
jgi:hypothetical protein